MKVLQLSHKPPFPPIDGGCIGINNVSYGLTDLGVELKLISINTPKHHVDADHLPDDYKQRTGIQLVDVDTDVKAHTAFVNLFGSKSYHLTRFYSIEFERVLIRELTEKDYDIVLLEAIFLAEYIPLIRKHSSAKLVLRSPNVEYLIWDRISKEERNPLKRAYLKLLAQRLENTEKKLVQAFDGIVCVSEKDQEFYAENGFTGELHTIPTGIDVMKPLSFDRNDIEYPSLFHLGALDWIPNQEGLNWFLSEVWPALHKNNPDLQFHIAGRRPPKSLLELDIPGVHMHGEIDDAAKFIKRNAIMVVPLFSGSGMRVKIIEGMMLGKAIVSTPIGAEGIRCTHDKDILLADTANDFRKEVQRLLDDQTFFRKVSQNAYDFAVANYSQKKLMSDLLAFLNKVL